MASPDDSVKHFEVRQPNLLSEILYDEYSINSKEFKTLIDLGAIFVNDERQTKDGFVFQKYVIRTHLSPRRYNCSYPWKSLVIFENDFCLVLNKPSGIPSHPTNDNILENALTQTSLAKNIPLFVTHRLDTLTSGLIVYAKKQSFVKSFNVQLQERTIRKKYVALIESSKKLPKRLTHYMNPASGRPKKLSDTLIDGWDICELEILEQKEISPNQSWVKINLLTGRTHQIRSQLSHLQAPIVGDTLYGAKLPFKKDSIALRSCEIEFYCNDEHLKFNISEEFTSV
ncbi:pseudouridine synthase family protein [Pseudobdellovibrio sp. HCB154]|uniref:pseudouridine synthase family protein n=1 Tax=Pseudobdellovibrio sp. HCB154 TaxID=3386277 RepID=UPI0039175582